MTDGKETQCDKEREFLEAYGRIRAPIDQNDPVFDPSIRTLADWRPDWAKKNLPDE